MKHMTFSIFDQCRTSKNSLIIFTAGRTYHVFPTFFSQVYLLLHFVIIVAELLNQLLLLMSQSLSLLNNKNGYKYKWFTIIWIVDSNTHYSFFFPFQSFFIFVLPSVEIWNNLKLWAMSIAIIISVNTLCVHIIQLPSPILNVFKYNIHISEFKG